MVSSLKTAPLQTLRQLATLPEVEQALGFFETNAAAITEEQIRICSVPATPFAEQERAEYLADRFRELGLSVSIDEEGNCLGLFAGRSASPLIVVSAHLDTVFAKGTDFTVHRNGERLLAPGIADDGCGLVALLAIIQALRATQIKLEGSILFVGTVGEEGEGNLRGVRHLFTKGPWAKRKIDAFLSFDGPGMDRITNRALGSRRYRVEVAGPGGHSWGDFGLPNPVHALGRAISRLAAYPVPRDPRTTFNVGSIEGGTSVNAIPSHAAMEVDLRSAGDAELRRLDAFFRRAMKEATEEENAIRRPGDPPLKLQLNLIGERPSGETPADSRLVKLAIEATRLLGVEPRLDQSSTDSNLPISLGIPAVTLGAGGTSGASHTLAEWYDPRDRDKGLKRGLLVILGLAGV